MKIIIGTAGEIASGKETFGRYVVQKYGGSIYRFSDPLKDILNRMYLPIDRNNYHLISMALRKYFGQDALSKIVHNDIKESKDKIIILDGIRRPKDIEYVKKIKGFKLIFIDTDIIKRYERLRARREKADDKKKSYVTFKKEHDTEVERKIRTLKKVADFVINNNGMKKEFYEKIDEIIKKLIKNK